MLAGTTLNALSFDSNFAQGATFDPATGILYHAAYNRDTFAGELHTIDPATGDNTLVNALGTNLNGTAQYTDIAVLVPEPGSAALLCLGAVAMLRRRR